MIKTTRPELSKVQREALELGASGKLIPESTRKRGGEQTRGFSTKTCDDLRHLGYITHTTQTRRYRITDLGRRALANFSTKPEMASVYIWNRSYMIKGEQVTIEDAAVLVEAGKIVIIPDADRGIGREYVQITDGITETYDAFDQMHYVAATSRGLRVVYGKLIHVLKRIAILHREERDLFILLQAGTYATSGRDLRQQESDKYNLRIMAEHGLVQADNKYKAAHEYTLTDEGIEALNYAQGSTNVQQFF